MPFDRSQYITRGPIEDMCFDFLSDASGFIADSLFTPKIVDKSIKKAYQADTSKLRFVETRKGTNAEPNLVDEQLFSINITLEEHKLGREINPREVRDADIPSLVGASRASKHVMNMLMLRRELLAATLATTVGNYPSGLTAAIAAGSRWNEGLGDPESDKVNADAALRNSCGAEANALAMAVETFDKLKLSPNFRDRVKYTGNGPVTLDHMKAFFNVDYVFLGRNRYDSANEGLAPVIGGFWGTNAIFFRYNPSPSLEDISYGHLYTTQSPFWSKLTTDEKRNGPAGSMKRLEIGTEYAMQPGYVPSSTQTTLFGAGYLFRTVVT